MSGDWQVDTLNITCNFLYCNHPVHRDFLITLLLLLLLLLLLIIIGIQPLGRSGQRPELSQATGMALVCCILGKFLGVVCHCFPPRSNIPTLCVCVCVCVCIYIYIYDSDSSHNSTKNHTPYFIPTSLNFSNAIFVTGTPNNICHRHSKQKFR